jgi:hypothetical protein
MSADELGIGRQPKKFDVFLIDPSDPRVPIDHGRASGNILRDLEE